MSGTTTATIIEAGDGSTLFMLPGMAAPEQDLQLDPSTYNGRVRFDNECVLIQESPKAKRSMVLTKSYSLPLWKRKGPSSDSDLEDSTRPSARSPSPEDSRVVIKVPIPTFRRRSSRSPSRGRSVSTSPVVPTLPPPCLVHRSPSSSPIISRNALSPVRRPSLTTYHRRKDEITVPLRACCQDCERITEECLKEGESWQEKFSRGAKRLRSASFDQASASAARPVISNVLRTSKDFSALSMGVNEALEMALEAAANAEAAASPRIGATSTFSLTVDEVDKRRKSIDFSKEADDVLHQLRNGPPSPTSQYFPSYGSPYSPHTRYIREREASTSSTISSTSADELSPDILDARHHTLRGSPIEEEDEAQLFPLPRRSSSRTPSPRVSPAPSPNASSSYLPGVVAQSGSRGSPTPRRTGRSSPASSSKESVGVNNSSQESLLRASLSRKPPTGLGVGMHLEVPSSSSSRSSSRNVSPSSPLASSFTDSSAPNTTGASPKPTEKVLPPIPTPKKTSSAHGPNNPKGPKTPQKDSVANPVTPKAPRQVAKEKADSSKSSSVSIPEITPQLPTTNATSGKPSSLPTTSTPTRSKTLSEPSHSDTSVASSSSTGSTTLNSTQSPSPLSHQRIHSESSTITSPTTSPPPTTPTNGKQGRTRERSASSPQSPSPHPRRKLSFTAPFIRAGGAIRDASVDVLKGVSSMGGSAVL